MDNPVAITIDRETRDLLKRAVAVLSAKVGKPLTYDEAIRIMCNDVIRQSPQKSDHGESGFLDLSEIPEIEKIKINPSKLNITKRK